MRSVVKVELVGLLPELFKLCPKGANICSLEPAAEQMRDYPTEVQQTQTTLAGIYNNLQEDFGWRVVPLAVGTLTPRGFWLSLRHRLGQSPAVVVGGGRVVPAEAGYDAVKLAVAEALEHR